MVSKQIRFEFCWIGKPMMMPSLSSWHQIWIELIQTKTSRIRMESDEEIYVLIPADESEWLNQGCVNQRIMRRSWCSTALWQTGHFAKERCVYGTLKPGQDFAEQSVVQVTALGSHSSVWTALASNDGKKEGHTKQQRCPEDNHSHRASHNRQLTDLTDNMVCPSHR